MAVVCLDITTADLAIFTNTASIGTAADKALFDWTTIATEISITGIYIACGAVHLYAGQTVITEDDIYRSADPRVAFGKQGGFYQTIQDNGTPETRRPILNFIGATVADNPGNNSTDVTVTGGGSSDDSALYLAF